jgi:tRNA (guanine37-N1)-methyltransferase
MKAYALKVKKILAEKTRKKLIKNGLLLPLEIKKNENFVYFPVREKVKGVILMDFEYKEREKVNVPFEIIGDIAIFESKDKSKKEKVEIAKRIMEIHKNVKSVFCKAGGVKGIFRTRKLEFVYGENRSETTHKESGCVFKLDVKRVYFSPRLQFERARIAKQIKDGERVFVPFAGVGPFPIVIARLNRDKNLEIYANELNPIAFKYLKENIKLNKVKIFAIYGDARKKLKVKKFKNFADRVIMPIPMSSESFLDIPFYIGKKGCIVHFYHFSKNEKDTINLIKNFAKKVKRKIKVIFSREVRGYSKEISEFVIDFKIL